jgi:hypothetical protein
MAWRKFIVAGYGAIWVRSYWDGRSWSFYADTYFTVPAYDRRHGHKVNGVLSYQDEKPMFWAYK